MAIDEQTIQQFVMSGHGNAAAVREMLAAEPGLLNVRFAPLDESALDAAAHVGNREIAQFLLDAGSPKTIYAAAMLGEVAIVTSMLRRDPSLASRPGVHGLSLLFHAALSGNPAAADAVYATSPAGDMNAVLHAAVASGNLPMVEWALAQEPDVNTPRYDQKTPLQVALGAGNAAIAARLRKAGARE
ncbi:MAG: ankyrin repeat domain-containing protein [Chloroflexi bacterium]|nr:ankyrin repeat domain-containing protein [Chloroflexota bacterium]